MEFRDLSLIHFVSGPSIQELEEYGGRMEAFLDSHYETVHFSKSHFLQILQGCLRSYEPHGNIYYEFDVGSNQRMDIWRIRFRVTQISHLEAEIVNRDSRERLNDNAMSVDLVEQGLADVVTLTSQKPNKGLAKVFGRRLSADYIGKELWIYLSLKIKSIDSLLNRFRWKPIDNDGFNFFEFAARIVALVQTRDNSPFVKVSLDESDTMLRLIKSYDDQICGKLSGREIEELFKLISIKPEEWLNAKTI